jgi:hypothetical protein
MTENNIIDTLEIERTSLAAHVDLCAQRYAQLMDKFDVVDDRLDRIESVLETIAKTISTDKTETLKTYLAWSGVVITGLFGMVGFLVNKLLF